MPPSAEPILHLADPAVFAKRASARYELRGQAWAYLESPIHCMLNLLFSNESRSWGICYDATEEEQLQAEGRGEEPLSEVSMSNPVAIVSLIDDNVLEGRKEGVRVEIQRTDVSVRIYVDGTLLKYGDKCALLPDATVRVNYVDYVYRSLWDITSTPYSAGHYRLDPKPILDVGRTAIYVAKHIQTNHAVVVKTISVPVEELSKAASMIRMCDELIHENIVRPCDWYMCPEDLGAPVRRISIVTPLAPRGNLYDFTIARGNLCEPVARSVMAQLVDGLLYMHGRDILHGNVRPENILVYQESESGIPTIKLSGFSFARRSDDYESDVEASDCVKALCDSDVEASDHIFFIMSILRGSMQNMQGMTISVEWSPPELLQCQYSELSEAFSVGAVMFFILRGKPLYYVDDKKRQTSPQRQIEERRSNHTMDGESTMSIDAHLIIKCMTRMAPSGRLSLGGARYHQWLRQVQVPPPCSEPYDYDDPVVQAFINEDRRPANLTNVMGTCLDSTEHPTYDQDILPYASPEGSPSLDERPWTPENSLVYAYIDDWGINSNDSNDWETSPAAAIHAVPTSKDPVDRASFHPSGISDIDTDTDACTVDANTVCEYDGFLNAELDLCPSEQRTNSETTMPSNPWSRANRRRARSFFGAVHDVVIASTGPSALDRPRGEGKVKLARSDSTSPKEARMDVMNNIDRGVLIDTGAVNSEAKTGVDDLLEAVAGLEVKQGT
ncbi:kinase-like protein [Punctularia strigosozonata HHB-11173 SS5]|uniref:Kinase-like protein n=1 Tax=Punctularia strigosozonata (strain HHB-11173) TaxID=741275 RepID=R7S3P5_PUNST|nr:kinase-like protein [Punctularia strigosozonata HHB-11173 SS5]EIN04422.1 kinase-like protein [Punctularia strigosozonata HHB-11173 SS5]